MTVQTLLAPRAQALTPAQMNTLMLLERIGGSISLVAVVLIFLAYALAPRVRNVQNTFIVFASVANMGASVASIIALDGLHEGVDSALCQGQGFLFQMFMQSDPWWSLAMAFNVFLVFFFRTSPDAFRRWWWLYCVVCYGGPFIIALTLLLVRHPGRGRIYGQATIWCWVDTDWENIRIYSYYMLVWICIVGSLLFYTLVGYQVFHSRNRLKSLSASQTADTGIYDQKPRVDLHVPADCFYGRIITEVQVVQSTVCPDSFPMEPKAAHTHPSTLDPLDGSSTSPIHPVASHYMNYSTVTCSPTNSPTRKRPLRRMKTSIRRVVSKFVVEDPIKRAYLRTSLLFALSVLATWIPSSMNRIHSWLVGDSPYEYHVATAAVLPLQGLWNAAIFFITSHRALRESWKNRNLERPGDIAEAGMERSGSTDIRLAGGVSFLDDTESGSDVELRRMAEAPGKRAVSL